MNLFNVCKFLVFIFIYTTVNSQSLNIGFDINFYGLSRDYKNLNSGNQNSELSIVPLPVGYFLNLGYEFSDKLSGNVKAGYTILPDMSAPELGAEFMYQFRNGVQLIIPYYLHLNGDSGGNFSGQTLNTLHLIGFGIGHKLSRITSVELIYLTPLNNSNQIGWSSSQDLSLVSRSYLSSLIKLGFQFTWPIFD